MRLVTCWGLLSSNNEQLHFGVTEGRRTDGQIPHAMILKLPREAGGLSSWADPVSKDGKAEEEGREGRERREWVGERRKRQEKKTKCQDVIQWWGTLL